MSKRFTQADIDAHNARINAGKVNVPEPGDTGKADKQSGKADKQSGKADKQSKYLAKRVEVDGIKFDSKKEACRYIELKAWERLGVISDLQRQVTYQLSVCKYIADFVYQQDGVTITEDVKSVYTRKLPVYRLKKKMMLHELGIKIKEI